MNNLQEFAQPSPRSTGEAPEANALRGIICECTANHCVETFGSQLEAIVLTGSMARDEASFVRKEESWELYGDAEFMIVFEKHSALPHPKLVYDVRQRIEEALRQRGILCMVDLGVVTTSYFRHLPHHIFSYELKYRGRVIRGDERILQMIPAFSADDMSLEDAWRLLCNRLVEVLECAPELSRDEKRTSAKLQYKILKLYLDMATSFLVFVGAYAPSYRERQVTLRQLAVNQMAQPTNYPFEIGEFSSLVDCCTDQKLFGRGTSGFSLDLSWSAAVQTAHSLWYWELARLANAKKSLSDRDLLRQWMRTQPFRARIRGWAYLVRARRWRSNFRDWVHCLHLCWRASPRYWIYFVASLLIFQRASEMDSSNTLDHSVDCKSLYLYLPFRRTAENREKPLSWESVASETVWNYREFVVGTRA